MIELPLLPKGKEGFTATDMNHPSPHAAPDLRRVLIVDDNIDSAEALGTLLKLRGYTVSIAYDGGSALATASRQPPHVVFLDIGLPDMTGYDVAARLRRLDGGSGGMRLVALTGYGLGHRGGQDPSIFDHYMLKPIAMEKLKSVLEAG
jgi:CheY-like chemotaxis protein